MAFLTQNFVKQVYSRGINEKKQGRLLCEIEAQQIIKTNKSSLLNNLEKYQEEAMQCSYYYIIQQRNLFNTKEKRKKNSGHQ